MRVESLAITPTKQIVYKLGEALLLLIAGLILSVIPLTLAAILVVGVIAFGLTLVRLEYGLCLLAFAIPFGTLKQWQTGSFGVSATEFVVAALVMAWMARVLAERGMKIIFTPIPLPLTLFLGALILSMSVAPSPALSLKETLKWLELLVVFLIVFNSVKERRQVKMILGAMVVAALLEALYGYYQFFTRSGPPGYAIGGGFLRPFGTFGQPNPFAGYLGLTLALATGLLVGAGEKLGGRLSRPAILLGGAGMIILVAMFMSMSRGAWFAFFAAFCVMLGLKNRRSLFYLAFLLLLVILLALLGAFNVLPSAVTARLSLLTDYFQLFDVNKVIVTPENWALVERMANWQAAWNMFTDSPLFGKGVGNFIEVYPHYALPQWRFPAPHAHNYYLNLLAETGILGLAAYLAFVSACLAYAGRTLARLRSSAAESSFLLNGYSLTLGIIGLTVALTVHNLFDNLYVHSMAVQVGLALGLLGVAQERW